MAPNEAVYHHLIPQTYMKPWCFNAKSIWVYDKTAQISEVRNIENICGINYFHSIRAGSLHASEKSLSKIWGFLLDYHISLNGETLSSAEMLNRHYNDFDEWEILYPKGAKVNKADRNSIKQRIQQTKDNDIEEQWSFQFENAWAALSETLYTVLSDIKLKKPVSLTTKAASDLMRYVIMFDWRGFKGNEQLNEALSAIDAIFPTPLSSIGIPMEDRTHPMYKTAMDEIRHNYLIHAFEQFLENDGVMYEHQRLHEENLTFLFLFAADGTSFLTSDNPSFTFLNKAGYREQFLAVLPKLAISLAKKDPDNPYSYKIIELSKDETDEYNYQIFAYAERVVLDTNEIDPTAYL